MKHFLLHGELRLIARSIGRPSVSTRFLYSSMRFRFRFVSDSFPVWQTNMQQEITTLTRRNKFYERTLGLGSRSGSALPRSRSPESGGGPLLTGLRGFYNVRKPASTSDLPWHRPLGCLFRGSERATRYTVVCLVEHFSV